LYIFILLGVVFTMNCFMFPGQPLLPGPQHPDDDDFRAIARLVRERTGLYLHDLSWSGKPSTESVALQVYGVAMSLYHGRRLSREGLRPSLIAEHSMGIYAALAVSGALREEDALELTFRIGLCLSRMADTGDYAFGCMVGLPLEPLLAIAENNGVYLANHNTSRHFLLSGERMKMESAVTEALHGGAFSAKIFPCDAPLHSPLMEVVADSLRNCVADYCFGEPSVPLMNHIDQNFLTGREVADFLLRELLLPVYWEKCYRALLAAGVTRFIEVGVGEALKKYNRWIENEAARS
jgi:malonyl CoA-acyl carrier protein transacylase